MNEIQSLEESLLLLINHDGGAFADQFWWLVSKPQTWIFTAVVVIISLMWRIRKPKDIILFVLCFGVMLMLADNIPAHYARPFFARPRPSHNEHLIPLLHFVNNYTGGDYGFFSSHASNSFSIVTLIALLFRKRSLTITLFLWATLLCVSRLYLGVHYVGDLLAGTVYGVVLGWITYKVYLFFREKEYYQRDLGSLEDTFRKSFPVEIIWAVLLNFLVLVIIAIFKAF